MGTARRPARHLGIELREPRTGRVMPVDGRRLKPGPELGHLVAIHEKLAKGEELAPSQKAWLRKLLWDLSFGEDVRPRFYVTRRGTPQTGIRGKSPLDAYVIALDVELRNKNRLKGVARDWNIGIHHVRRLRTTGRSEAEEWLETTSPEELEKFVARYRNLWLRNNSR